MENIPSVTAVPTPVSLIKYLIDSSYQHEDFTLTSACTLKARVNFNNCVLFSLLC